MEWWGRCLWSFGHTVSRPVVHSWSVSLSISVSVNGKIIRILVSVENGVLGLTLFIVPVQIHNCETWATARYLCAQIDGFDIWALSKIFRMLYTQRVTISQMRSRGSVIVSPAFQPCNRATIEVFGYIACSALTTVITVHVLLWFGTSTWLETTSRKTLW